MNERQRADELARAIDELIHGTTPPVPAQADDELRSLISVARSRMLAHQADAAPDHQSNVWQRVMERLEGRPQARREVSQDVVADDAMRQTIMARREMSNSILDLAEQHREEVWARIQDKIGRGPRKTPPARGGPGGKGEDRPMRTRFFPTGDEDLDALLNVELSRTTLRDIAEREASASSRNIHDRVRHDPAKHPPMDFSALSPDAHHNTWARFAFLGGLVMLVGAAIGPLPATGVAHHPAMDAMRYVQHMGVAEATVPPPTSVSSYVQSQQTTAHEASEFMGFTVSAPPTMLGMPGTASVFFPSGVSSPTGAFVITYTGLGTNLTLYQEAAGGANLAIAPGEAQDVAIGNTLGTYFEGGWSTDGGSPVWHHDGSATLLFERDGVRYTIVYSGPRVYVEALLAAASALG